MKKHGIQNPELLAGKSPEVTEWVTKAHSALPEPYCLVIVPVLDQATNTLTVRTYKAHTMQHPCGQFLGLISQGLESTAYMDGTGIEARTFVIEKPTAKGGK